MKSCGIFILIVLAVVAGLALGLFLGWVVWPVQWINASPVDLRTEFQTDWVNMAIDSYSVNQNAQLAAQRFTYLGEDGPKSLAAVLANPQWVTEADAQAYAEAVKQELGADTVTVPTTETAAPTLGSRLLKMPLFAYVVVALFLALLAVVLLVILVVRLLNNRKEETVPEAVAPIAVVSGAETAQAEGIASEPESATTEIAPGEEMVEPQQADASTGEMAAAGVAVAGVIAAAESAGEPEAISPEEAVTEEVAAPGTEAFEAEIPATMAEEPSEGGAGTVAKVLAGGAAIAGIAGAIGGSDEEKEVETAQDMEELEAEAPIAPAEEISEGGAGTVGKVLVGGAAVAGIAGAIGGSDEEKEVETAPDETAGVVSAVEEVAGGKPEFEGVVDTVEGAIEDTKPVKTAAAEGAALAGVEWALESQAQEETPEPASDLFPPTESVLPAEGEEPAVGDWIPEAPSSELDTDYLGKYNRKVIDIEGIGEAYTDRLAEAGITTTHALLQQCATSKGREELAKKTGISGKLILEWANHADMMRVQGIGPQWSDLLEMAGVDTVRELALRNPSNLYQKLAEINDQKKLVRKLPTEAQLEDWIEQAKDLPRILTY